jgi:type II secretory ATPase GspE/PulE/Tfp pilus assembly ATPase PilB-like protein
MTGHLVLTTLHAQTAAAAVQRLLDIGVDPGVIGTSINCLVAQRLVRRLCSDCAEPHYPTPEELRALDVPDGLDELMLLRAVGCPECGGTGYRGRIGLFEVLPVNDDIAGLIGHPTREIQAAAQHAGMFSLRDDGVRIAIAGITSLDEVRRVAGDRM